MSKCEVDEKKRSSWKHVYIMRFDDGLTKLGVAKNVNSRKVQHERNRLSKCVECFYTDECSNPFQIETMLKENLSTYMVENTEWGRYEFNYGKSILEEIFAENAIYDPDREIDIEELKRLIGYGQPNGKVMLSRDMYEQIIATLQKYSDTTNSLFDSLKESTSDYVKVARMLQIMVDMNNAYHEYVTDILWSDEITVDNILNSLNELMGQYIYPKIEEFNSIKENAHEKI